MITGDRGVFYHIVGVITPDRGERLFKTSMNGGGSCFYFLIYCGWTIPGNFPEKISCVVYESNSSSRKEKEWASAIYHCNQFIV